MGFDGVEILQVQMTDTSPAALRNIKRRAFTLGLGISGTGVRKTYIHHDQRKGDVYLTIMRAIAADPPKLTIPYTELQDRLKQVTKDEPPDGASVIGTLNKLSQIAQQNMPPTGPALEWDEQEQVIVVTDPYLLYYLRWSTFLEKEAEAEA
jgi:hypothetical protein